MQLKVSKAQRKRLTQAQKAQIVDIEEARKLVLQAIEEMFDATGDTRLSGEEVDHLYNNQPVHYDGMGYVPRWFEHGAILGLVGQAAASEPSGRCARPSHLITVPEDLRNFVSCYWRGNFSGSGPDTAP